jgi:hypothetical protein
MSQNRASEVFPRIFDPRENESLSSKSNASGSEDISLGGEDDGDGYGDQEDAAGEEELLNERPWENLPSNSIPIPNKNNNPNKDKDKDGFNALASSSLTPTQQGQFLTQIQPSTQLQTQPPSSALASASSALGLSESDLHPHQLDQNLAYQNGSQQGSYSSLLETPISSGARKEREIKYSKPLGQILDSIRVKQKTEPIFHTLQAKMYFSGVLYKCNDLGVDGRPLPIVPEYVNLSSEDDLECGGQWIKYYAGN